MYEESNLNYFLLSLFLYILLLFSTSRFVFFLACLAIFSLHFLLLLFYFVFFISLIFLFFLSYIFRPSSFHFFYLPIVLPFCLSYLSFICVTLSLPVLFFVLSESDLSLPFFLFLFCFHRYIRLSFLGFQHLSSPRGFLCSFKLYALFKFFLQSNRTNRSDSRRQLTMVETSEPISFASL